MTAPVAWANKPEEVAVVGAVGDQDLAGLRPLTVSAPVRISWACPSESLMIGRPLASNEGLDLILSPPRERRMHSARGSFLEAAGTSHASFFCPCRRDRMAGYRDD
jgi:hypothetical protein